MYKKCACKGIGNRNFRTITPARFLAATAALGLALALNTSAGVLYVDLNNASPVLPYASWATAATNIQDAVDAASPGDQILVTNGVYQTGGRVVSPYLLTNRVAVTKPLSLQSVNGPAVTVIQGYQMPGVTNGTSAIRCVYLTNGASLTGFTLTNGATRNFGDSYNEQSGGGVWCESTRAVLSNCMLAGNAAPYGGGAAYSLMYNCTLTGNSAGTGGGTYDCGLINCTLTGNSANDGGAAGSSNLTNCTVDREHRD